MSKVRIKRNPSVRIKKEGDIYHGYHIKNGLHIYSIQYNFNSDGSKHWMYYQSCIAYDFRIAQQVCDYLNRNSKRIKQRLNEV